MGAILVVTGCTSDGASPVDPDVYRSELADGCRTARLAQEALVEPADSAGVPAFANAVADLLNAQADAARGLAVPEDLDDDHRAFVQNTVDQANRWSELAVTPPTDSAQFGAIQGQILELALGRDDLAVMMEVPSCSVSTS